MTEFKLYPMQRRALITKATEVLYGGALGGGKSYLARVASIVYSLEIPGLITYLFRRTFKEVLANHVHTPGGYLDMLKDLIESGDCVYSKSDYSFTFYNGSRIQLAHSQHENDIYAHQGAQIGFLILDESTHFTPTMVRFIRSRVRLGSLVVPAKWKGLFPRILYTANPGNVGHHFFKSNFVDFGAGHVFEAPEDEGGMMREYVPAKLVDNKILMANDPDYIKRVRGMGDTQTVKAMIDGDWESLSTGGFADLWRAKYHVIKPFAIPFGWTIDRCYDYGSSAPAACTWFAESNGEEFVDGFGSISWVPSGTLFQIGELYFANKKLEGLRLAADEQARRIKQYEIDEGLWGRVIPGPADNAINDAPPGTKSIAADMAAAPNNITWTRSIKSPGSRVTGMQLLRTRLAASKKRPMENAGFFVFANCFHTIRTLPNLEPDPKNVEDIDSSGEDHLYDTIRYKVLSKAKTVKTTKLIGT